MGLPENTVGIKVIIEAEIYPTEDPRKVFRAINTIVPFNEEMDDVEISGDEIKLITIRKEGHESLIKLRSSLRSNKILDTARSLLLTRRHELRPLRFHKQAAYGGKVRLCDKDEISPLGVITLRIEYEGDPVILANWLTPKTEKGRPIEEATIQDLLHGTNSDRTRD